MRLIVNPAGSDHLKVLEFDDLEAAKAAVVDYMNQANANGVEPPVFYRIIMPSTARADIRLRRLRLKPSSVVTTTVIESADVEDDV